MKRFAMYFVVVMMAAFLISGCAAFKELPIRTVLEPMPGLRGGGLVPQDFENPVMMPHEITLFWGNDPWDLIPDPNVAGGWMYNRPAIMIFPAAMACATNEHAYTRVNLPRNACFVGAGRTENIWGKGFPYSFTFCTGSNPGVARYNMFMPGSPTTTAGGYPVMLQDGPIMPSQGSMNLQVDVNPSAYGISGRPIAQGLRMMIYGR